MIAVLLKTRMLANHVGQLEAVQLRHAHVHQDDGDVGFQQDVESFLAEVALIRFSPRSARITS